MNHEKNISSTESESAEPLDPNEFFSYSHDDQIIQLDDALSNLDLVSEGLEHALGNAEVDRLGKTQVTKESSLFSKIKLGLFKNGKEYNEALAQAGKQVAEKNLSKLELGLGADIIALKEKISTHESVSRHDLNAIKGLKGFEDFSSKIAAEQETLRIEKDLKEQELQDQITEHPAFQKNEQLNDLLDKYGHIEKLISEKRHGIEVSIIKYENTFHKIKGEGDASQEIKNDIEEQLAILKQQFKEISQREEGMKERISLLKSSSKEIAPFVNRLSLLGKTKAEIIADKKKKIEDNRAQTKKQSEAKKTPPNVNKNVDQQPTAKEEPLKSSQASQDNQNHNQHYQYSTSSKEQSSTAESPESLTDKLKSYSQSSKEWATNIRKIAPALVGKDILAYFEKKVKIGNIDGLAASHMLAQFLIQKKTISKLDKATEKATEIITRLII